MELELHRNEADDVAERVRRQLDQIESDARAIDEAFIPALERSAIEAESREAQEEAARRAKRYQQSGAWNLYDGLHDPLQKQENPWGFDGAQAAIGCGVVVQDSGEGKTWLLIEKAICKVAGLPLCGYFACRGVGPAVLLLEEDDKPNAIDRGSQIVRGKRLQPDELQRLCNLHFLNFSGWQLDTPEGIARLREIVGDIRPLYVGLDPMAEFHSQPENDSMKMLANLLRPVRSIAIEFGCFIDFSHHTRKAYAGQDNDQKQTARGTGAIKGWATSAWFLKNNGGVISVETKQRKGSSEHPAVPSFSLQRIENREEKTQRWEVVTGIENDIQARHDSVAILEKVRAAGTDGITSRALEDSLSNLSGKRFCAAVAYLETAKIVDSVSASRTAKDGKTRKQKILKFSPTGELGTTGVSTGD